jgi:hypothetical protein
VLSRKNPKFKEDAPVPMFDEAASFPSTGFCTEWLDADIPLPPLVDGHEPPLCRFTVLV